METSPNMELMADGPGATLPTYLAAASAGPSPEPIIRIAPGTMFQDGLHIIGSYLGERDWLITLQVCHHWSESLVSCSSRGISYPIKADGTFRSPPPTRLLHHFTRFKYRWPLTFTMSRFLSIGRDFPYLSELRIGAVAAESVSMSQDFTGGASTLPSCTWPIKLEELHFGLGGMKSTGLIRVLPTCLSLVQLSLYRVSVHEDFTAFREYNQFIGLESFSLGILGHDEPKNFDVLTAMNWHETGGPPNLRYLDICYGSPNYFSLNTFSRIGWKKIDEISLSHLLTEGDLQYILEGAPNLTLISLITFPSNDLRILKEFHSLRTLSIWSSPISPDKEQWESGAINAICDCARLTSIQFSDWVPTLSASWLLLSTLPKLTEITFDRRPPEVLDVLLPLKTLQKLVFIHHKKYASIFARDYFRSSAVIPQLCRIQCITSGSSHNNWIWMKDDPCQSTKLDDQFRVPPVQPIHQTVMVPSTPSSGGSTSEPSTTFPESTIHSTAPQGPASTKSYFDPTTTEEAATPPASRLVGIELNPGPTDDRTITNIMTPTASIPIVQPHQRVVGSTLFADGLHIIYSYLSDHEFFQVLHVSRHWSHCCGTSPSRQMEYYSVWMKDDSEHISRDSRLNYHFTRFESPQNTASRLYLNELTAIIQLLPHLTSIDISIKKQSIDFSDMDSIEWPHRLSSLKCNFYGYDYPHLFSSICQLRSLTSLTFGSVGSPCCGFRPSDSFRLLTQLITLSIWPTNPTTDDPLQLSTAPIIWLPPTITELSVFSKHFIRALPRIKNLRQIRKLSLVYHNLESNDLRMIHSRMPELEMLDGVQLCLTDLDDIILFTRLGSLHIQQFPHHNFLHSMHHLIDCMGQLSQLTHLQLKPDIFPIDEYWSHLHRSLSHLISLQLDAFTTQSIPTQYLTSFSDRLKRLTITGLNITQSDLIIISTLIQLEYLSLTHLIEDSSKIKPPQQHLNELKDFFDSSSILPHLRELHLICVSSNGSRLGRFIWDQQKPINTWTYRLKSHPNNQPQVYTTALTPPEPLLVGIETNPGPVDPATTPPGGPIIPASNSSPIASSQITATSMFRDGLRMIYSFLTMNLPSDPSRALVHHIHTIGNIRGSPITLTFNSTPREACHAVLNCIGRIPSLTYLHLNTLSEMDLSLLDPLRSWTKYFSPQPRCVEIHETPPETPPAQPLVGIELNPGPTRHARPGSNRWPTKQSKPKSSLHFSPQTFFQDGLSCIYEFLTLHEWILAVRICRYWYESARRHYHSNKNGRDMSEVHGLTVRSFPKDLIGQSHYPGLRKHISRVTRQSPLDLTSFIGLMKNLPGLTSFNGSLMISPGQSRKPVHICELKELTLDVEHLYDDDTQCLLDGIVDSCANSLIQLRLYHLNHFGYFHGKRPHHLNGFANLKELTHFTLTCHPSSSRNDLSYLLAPLKDCPKLEYLSYRYRNNMSLRDVELLSLPHLKECDLSGILLTPDYIQRLLLACPNLTRIDLSHSINEFELSLLKQFKQLHHLSILPSTGNTSTASQRVSQLSQLTCLTHLDMNDWYLPLEHEWNELFLGCPKLCHLTLQTRTIMLLNQQSFSLLRLPNVCQRIQTLDLSRCHLTMDALHLIHQLFIHCHTLILSSIETTNFSFDALYECMNNSAFIPSLIYFKLIRYQSSDDLINKEFNYQFIYDQINRRNVNYFRHCQRPINPPQTITPTRYRC